MNEMRPLVSIGVPTFNRAKQVARAVESALKQDYGNIEVVISDNASIDDTSEICQGIAERDNRVRYTRQPKNLGPIANFVQVRDLARGEFFMWLADDDWIDENYVTTCVRTLLADPRLALVAGCARYYQNEKAVYEGRRFQLIGDCPLLRMLAHLWGPYDNSVFYGVSRHALVIGIAMHRVIGGDWLFVAEVAARGAVIAVPGTAIHRAVGGTSRSLSSVAESLRLDGMSRAFPYLRLAALAFSEVVQDSGAFAHRSAPYRIWAGTTLFLAILVRHGLVHKVRSVPARLGQWLLGETNYTKVKSRMRRVISR